MATLRIDEDTFDERARGGEGRAADARREPAVRPAERDHLRPGVHGAPYKHPTIGSMEDLEAASIDDVRDFYRTYYVPANATLVLVGDFDSTQALQLVDAVPRARAEGRPAGAARHPAGAAADQGEARHARGAVAAAGRRRRATTSPTTATRIRTRCTSRRRCCPTARARASTGSWSTRSSWRWPRSAAATSSRIRTCSTRSRSCSRGTRRRRRPTALIAELDRLQGRADHASTSCSARRTSSRATTSSAASRTRRRRRSWRTRS